MLARAIDQRVTERVGRRRIAGPIRHELAQLGEGVVHLVGAFELEHAGEAHLGRVRVFLRGAVEQRERAVDVAVVREQVRARDDRVDAVLRAGGRELFQVLQSRIETLTLRLDARRARLRRHREFAAVHATVDLQRVVPRLARLGDRAEIEQRLVDEAAVLHQVAVTLRGGVAIAELEVDVGERALGDRHRCSRRSRACRDPCALPLPCRPASASAHIPAGTSPANPARRLCGQFPARPRARPSASARAPATDRTATRTARARAPSSRARARARSCRTARPLARARSAPRSDPDTLSISFCSTAVAPGGGASSEICGSSARNPACGLMNAVSSSMPRCSAAASILYR